MSLSNTIYNNDIITFKNLIDNNVVVTQGDFFLIIISGNQKMLKYLEQTNNKNQTGGFYGSPEIKEKLIKNIRRKECPICGEIINDSLFFHNLIKHRNSDNKPIVNRTYKETFASERRRSSLKNKQKIQKYKRTYENYKI
jgi:DNA repair exonuclease SbcCD ATPase subunit